MHGALRALRVSQQCFYVYENYPQMFEKEQWPPNNSLNLNGMDISCLGATYEAILNLHPTPRTVSELKIALEKIWDNFPQVVCVATIWWRNKDVYIYIKLSRILQVVWQECVNGNGRHYIQSKKYLGLSIYLCS